METDMRIVDPEGDVMLLVMTDGGEVECMEEDNANSYTADGTSGQAPEEDRQDAPGQDAPNESDNTEAEVQNTTDSVVMRIRVSSKHLTLASGYFRARLEHNWSEGKILTSKGYIELPVSGCDPEALLVLMKIIHCRTREVPEDIDVEMLYQLAKLVDYYDCLEATDFYATQWIRSNKYTLGPNDSDRLAKWVWICWAFCKKNGFQQAVRIIQRHSKGRVQNLEIPNSDRLADQIEEMRLTLVGNIIQSLYDQITKIIESDGYNPNSKPAILGNLLIELKRRHLFPPPVSPFPGLSFASLSEDVRSIAETRSTYYDYNGDFRSYRNHDSQIRFLIPETTELLRQHGDVMDAADYSEYLPRLAAATSLTD